MQDIKYVLSTETGEILSVHTVYALAVQTGLNYGTQHDCVVALHAMAADAVIPADGYISMKGAIELLNEPCAR